MINVNIHYTSKLKLEIVAGYLLLAFIWVFILYLVYKEREEKNVMERREIYWRKERKLTNSTFIQLLDLAAMGELVSGWTLDDYTAYQKKRMKVTALLQNLKNKQKDNQQRICINKVIYDCAHSSISETEPSDFDFYIIMEGSNWFHWSGITPAISDKAAELTLLACEVAKRHGITVSVDLNFHKKLWTKEKALSIMKPLIKYVDVCISN